MRVVLDTNVILSGILWKGIPGKIVAAWKGGAFDILVTDAILSEYGDVLKRFARGHEIDVQDILQIISEKAVWCVPMLLSEGLCTDPDDDKFIGAALGGSARFIVTGDKALLRVGKIGDVEVIKAKAFLEKV